MPQIPVFTPNQRIDASTPVAAINTTDARMSGEAISGFGAALERVGAVLDNTARKAAAQEDEYLLKQAINDARIDLRIKVQQQRSLPVGPEDAPTGETGVRRFQEEAKKSLGQYSQALPERLRSQFQANVSDYTFAESAAVLANEVEKREKNVMVLRQDNINKKADIARNDYTQLPSVLSELAVDIETDALIPGEMKPKVTLEAQQNALKAGVQGLIAKNQWGAAEKAIRKDGAALFTADQMDKELNDLRTQRTGVDNERWNNYSRTQQVKNDERKAKQDDAMAQHYANLTNAGNNAFAIDPVIMAIDNDYNLTTAYKNALKDKRIYSNVVDAQYEAKSIDSFVQNPDDAINATRDAVAGGAMSPQRGQALLSNLKVLKDAQTADPSFKVALDDNRRVIESFKEPRLYDPASGTYKESDPSASNQARAAYMSQAAALVKGGKGTPDELESLAYRVLKTHYSSQLRPLRVEGVSEDVLASSKNIKSALEDLRSRYKSGEFNTPEKVEAMMKKLSGLNVNQQRAQAREELEKHANKKTGN